MHQRQIKPMKRQLVDLEQQQTTQNLKTFFSLGINAQTLTIQNYMSGNVDKSVRDEEHD